MINDTINGLFEGIGALLGWVNVWKMYKDKQVRGIYWPISLFFTLWGVWNLYYYSSLIQWWSVVGASVMCTCNFAWVALAYKYRNE